MGDAREFCCKELISKCVSCRRLRGKVGEEIMTDLPPNRTKEELLFTYFGVGMFAPFEIKERRTTLKQYGALLTYLASQAIYVEMTKTLETDSSILALIRFIARRVNVTFSPVNLLTMKTKVIIAPPGEFS